MRYGHWNKNDNGTYSCSICQSWIPEEQHRYARYCLHCGAKMRPKVIPIEQLLSILPKYDDYIHTKTYPYNETMEDIYSKGHEDGWNACLKAIKEELDYWEKENAEVSD